MTTPYTVLPARYRWVLLVTLSFAVIVLAVALRTQGRPLVTAAAPRGILSYEFAFTRERARSVLTSWSASLETARQQLQLDFPFLMVYPLLFSLVCALLSTPAGSTLARLGAALSWCVLLAAPLDAIENAALLRMLGRGPAASLAALAGIAAALKFALLVAALLFALVQGPHLLIRQLRGP
jgi:hypothetical protein